jgi:hypothetical protein
MASICCLIGGNRARGMGFKKRNILKFSNSSVKKLDFGRHK